MDQSTPPPSRNRADCGSPPDKPDCKPCPCVPRLKLDESDTHVQRLLRETREENPRLLIENDSCDPRRPRPSACDFMS